MRLRELTVRRSWARLGAMVLWVSFAGSAASAFGQATIVESRPLGKGTQPAAVPTTPPAVDTYFQLQLLQEEVLELRGLVEQQAHEIKRLKQQRLDDYVDLDRRLSALGQRGAASPGTSGGANPSPTSAPAAVSGGVAAAAVSGATPAEELAAYRSAIDLVLKRQDYAGGATALKRYLNDFPNASYAANAQYWLGEIYSQQKNWPEAITWFKTLLDRHPNHQKAAEAKFKLGRAMINAGQRAEGRALIQSVAESDSAAAALARDFLSTL